MREYNFVMRPWTEEELDHCLSDAGFGSIACHGDCDVGKPLGSTDGIVAIDSLKRCWTH